MLEELRWKKFHTLNGQGYVCLVDVMGDESSIVQAARVSYGEGTKTPSDDKTLIRYLMRHRHSTPLEMVELKFLVYVPMDCWRQWIRHRMASVNEYSTRYSEAIDDRQTTPGTGWRLQSVSNKQGSGEYLSETDGSVLSARELELHVLSDAVYHERLGKGVAREQARKDLPLSTFTKAYWKIDLHNLLHFLGLRMDKHAQAEIREYATTIGEQIVAPLLPNVWQAFLDYRMNALTFTGPEISVINKWTLGDLEFAYNFEEATTGWNKREADEFRAKLAQIGVS